MQALFLPVGLCLALISALLFPDAGKALLQLGVIPLLVMTVFFINGLQLSLRSLQFNRSLLLTVLAASLISLGLGPVLGLAIAYVLNIEGELALGLAVMASAPATLSSCVVVTQLARGNTIWALMMTLSLNLAGIFTLPLLLPYAASVSDIVIAPWPLLLKLVKMVLLPFLAGMIVRPLLEQLTRYSLVRYLPSSCVIITAWATLCSNREALLALEWPLLVLTGAGALVIHGALMALCFAAGRLLQLSREEGIALLFTGSQKTLPVAVSVLVGLERPEGTAIVACLLFHFLHLLTDSSLASKLGNRPR